MTDIREYPRCTKCGSENLEYVETKVVVWSKEKQDFIDRDSKDEGEIEQDWVWCNNCLKYVTDIWIEE